MIVAFGPTGALELVALLVLLLGVPLLVLAILAGAAEYVRRGAEEELAALEAEHGVVEPTDAGDEYTELTDAGDEFSGRTDGEYGLSEPADTREGDGPSTAAESGSDDDTAEVDEQAGESDEQTGEGTNDGPAGDPSGS